MLIKAACDKLLREMEPVLFGSKDPSTVVTITVVSLVHPFPFPPCSIDLSPYFKIFLS